jgi:hypothetical protein
MRWLFFTIFFFSSLAGAEPKAAPVAARPTVDQLVRPEVILDTDRTRLWAAAQPALRTKLDGAIKLVLARADVKPKPGEAPLDLWADARKATAQALPGVTAKDIDVVAMLVVMQAAKAAQDDLKTLLARIKARRMVLGCRGFARCVAQLAPSLDVPKDALDEAKKDSSNLAELEALLGPYAERIAAMVEVISKLSKAAHDSAAAIIEKVKA